MTYDYMEVMKRDVEQYISENIDLSDYDRDELEEKLNDDLWAEDSVTGNASGSYTCDRYTAEQYVLDNMDLLNETVSEFCISAETVAEKFLNEYFEYFDVSIRCYLLGAAVAEVLNDLF